MTLRASERIVSFQHAFTLRAVDRRLPPGDYRVLSEEESIEGLSFLAFRNTSTSIELPLNVDGIGRATLQSTASVEVIQIEAVELETAMELDRNAGLTPSAAL